MINLSELQNAVNDYDNAKRRGMGFHAAKDRVKTILFNGVNEIIDALSNVGVPPAELAQANARIKTLERNIESLNKSLEESDIENNELRKALKAAKTGAE